MPNNEFAIIHEGRRDFWHYVEKYYQDEDDILLYGVLVCKRRLSTVWQILIFLRG